MKTILYTAGAFFLALVLYFWYFNVVVINEIDFWKWLWTVAFVGFFGFICYWDGYRTPR